RIVFGEEEGAREPLEVTAMDFIAVKSFKAKGKRLTNLDFLRIDALDPVEVEDAEWTEIEDNADDTEAETGDNAEAENMTDEKSDDEIRDELTGQGRIF
ncbi:MAG: DNA gyrase/topoisomerase IV subunit A, partial [Paramuribaculum sp.]|nr:DNA gyrase/topoisomerase IV subunit A [Paramuribaculum sp.]